MPLSPHLKTLADARMPPEPCTLSAGSVVATGYWWSRYGTILLASYCFWSHKQSRHPLSQSGGQHHQFCLENLLNVNNRCILYL